MSSKETCAELEQRIQSLKQTETELEKALNEADKQHRSILDTIKEGVILQSASGEILMFNKGAEEILGFKAEDIVGKEQDTWYFVHEDGTKCKNNELPFIKTLRTGIPITNQKMGVHRKPDDLRWISINTTPLFREKEAKPYAAAVSFTDITEQNQTKTEKLKSETRFRELAELMPEAVFEADLGMNILYVNQQAFSMFGYSTKDFQEGLNGIEMLAPKDRKRAKENFVKRIHGEISSAAEYLAEKKDGTVFPILLHASPMIENGTVSGLRGIIIDISNSKLMERRLIEAQKMESIGTLAGGIAHDFNNILSPIILHSEMTKNDLPEDHPLQISIQEIYKAGIRARDLVRQILTFARKGTEEKIVLSASKVVKDTVKFLRSTIPATIEIRYENKAEHDILVADPIQLNQVVMNLCTNAAYAMRKNGGQLELFLGNKDIPAGETNNLTGLNPGRCLEITVRDSGSGIPKKIIDKIFEPYFTTKGPGEGTGLGLSIIHGIVKSYGGSIRVESMKNRGTTFQVYIPLSDAEISEKFKHKTDTPKGSERILLVDDEEAGLAAMKKTLENLGYKVTASTSSLEAFDIFRNDPGTIDLVITDMTMPGMTGKDLIGVIRKIKKGLPTILCTGFSDQINENDTEKYGIDAFIMKPVIRDEIASKIREILDVN